jgi:hypothetical protein
MRRRTLVVIFVSAACLLLSDHVRPARAQGPLALWYKLAEKVDNQQLEHDQARLQDDLRRGDTARVNRDLEQIRRDEWWLSIDRSGRRFGPTPPLPLPQPAASIAAPIPVAVSPAPRVCVLIVNPEQTGVAVNYVVDGITCRTKPGGRQSLIVGPSSTVYYDRGGDFGVKRYSLSGGVYEFRSSDAGWQLVKLPPLPPSEPSLPR